MKSFIGTLYFVAPEVIKEKYDSNCDMWSIGATLYMLLRGEPPFLTDSKYGILHKIQYEEPSFSGSVWKKVSCQAKDFVKKLLIKNPQKRLSSAQALSHKFFLSINNTIHNKEFLNAEILQNLKNFENPKKFKKIILGSLLNYLTKDELHMYNRVFNAIDLNHEGFISSAELKKAFQKLGIFLKDEEVFEIVKKIDYDKNGKVNYSEFLMAAVNMKKAINEKRLYKLFMNFDTYNLGYIDKQSLKTALSRSGKEIENVQEIMLVIEEVAKDGNNKINFEDFFKIMNNNNNHNNN
jgi:calcium-dependent protein kinase